MNTQDWPRAQVGCVQSLAAWPDGIWPLNLPSLRLSSVSEPQGQVWQKTLVLEAAVRCCFRLHRLPVAGFLLSTALF